MAGRGCRIGVPGGLALALGAAAMLAPTALPAQGIEEVVVTARKRAESLQDVPISVQAIKGEDVAQQGLVDLQQLAPYTPNFSYTPAPGASDLFFMRGLGTFGSGIHFEPSIGQVFNGFFSTRSRLGRSALIDVAQIEVLKGPQGAIIGKNTSLGAINITTNKPTDTFETGLSVQGNFDASEGFEVEGFVSGPLTDRLRARGVVNYRDVDGWIDNQFQDDDLQQSEDITGRVMVEADVTDWLTAEVMYQRTDFEREGKARVILGCLEFQPPAGPPFSVPRTVNNSGFDCNGVDAQNSTRDLRREAPGEPVFPTGEPFDLESDFVGVTLTAEFENFEITSLTSWNGYEITDFFSGDQTAFERVGINNFEDYEQIYQEVRVTGEVTGPVNFDYIGGFTFFKGELDAFQQFHAVAGQIGPPVPAINPAVSRNEFQQSETDSFAWFGQVDWHLHEQLTFTLGLRLTDDDREGAKQQLPGEAYTSDLAAAPVGCNTPTVPLSACTNGNDGMTPGAPVTGEFDKTDLSHNASLVYRFSDDHTFYFTSASGYKSGGFDLRGGGNPEDFVFGEETTLNWEIGGKHLFMDGRLRFNWTLFRTEVEDLQVAANDPAIIQQIVAAADATSDGVEFDILWAATPNLSLSVVGAYTDAEYDEFIGSCYLGQVENGTGCFNVGISAGQRSGVQDLEGEQLPFAPEWSFVVGADYSRPLPVGNMTFGASAKYIYIDESFKSIERDPFGRQDATGRFDATVSLSGDLNGRHPWTVSLVGRNLFDELVHTFVNSSTLSGDPVVTSNLEETSFVALRASIRY